MIYCIGLRIRYEPALDGAAPVIKRGSGLDERGRPYPGGWVWRSVEEAQRHIDGHGLTATHNVYGLRADWEKDAEPVPGETYRRLKANAEVVRL